ncbi:MAG: ABC transporter ATP-binding protein, partial [Candidatus Methanomethylophilaceae archaeon]|nr:ABC transporter ATP-binding protein [Candidatus Methanomethylophilaceae archaeon]
SRNVTDLSGCQMQRVFIASSLAKFPSFYIFDEPTSALDLKHQMNTMIRMREVIRTNGSGMIVALHDMNLALNYTDRVIMLKNGRIHAHGPPEETITEENIREVYGVESRIVETEVGRYILPISPLNMEDDDP